MITHKYLIDEIKGKTYTELIAVRDELIIEVKAFEEYNSAAVQESGKAFSDREYQCKLEYLGKICELISKKYAHECVDITEERTPYLEILQNFLKTRKLEYNTSITSEIEKRKNGKKYYIQDYIKGMIYSMLTNQTKWYRIEPHFFEIDRLFYDYEPDKIISESPQYFCEGLFRLKCGSRSTKKQMEVLADNVKVLQNIEYEYGSIDNFIASQPTDIIVKKISDNASPYKIKMFGEALAWEFIRNVGVDGAKPDVHLRRFLGTDRMGTGKHSPATTDEVTEQIEKLSKQTGMLKAEIDNLIWSFCADGYGEICTINPHCTQCPIKQYCKYILK